jgi:hypothetical protein
MDVRNHRRPRAIAIAAPMTGARMMRDLAQDWQRWTPAERAAARLAAVLAAALCLGQLLLAG